MFYVVPQPTFYRPSYCYSSRPRPVFAARPSRYHYWHPFELLEEPSITWVIQRPSNDRDEAQAAAVEAKAPRSEPKTEPTDDGQATVVHRNTTTPKPKPKNEVKPFSVRIKLPDKIKADNLQVRVQNQTLFIAGEKRVTSDNFVHTTSFARQFHVGDSFDTDKMTAVINNDGVLVVTAPAKTKALPGSDANVPKTEVPPTEESKDEVHGDSAVSETPATLLTEETKQDSNEVPTPESPKSTSLDTTDKSKQVVKPVESKKVVVRDEKPVLVPFKLQVSQNDDKAFAVTVHLPPYVTAKELDLQVNKGILSISGEQRNEFNGSVLKSKFVRHFALDKTVELDKISASLDDKTRVLTVTVPKKPLVEPSVKKIEIQVGGAAQAESVEVKEEQVKPVEVSSSPSAETNAPSFSKAETEEAHDAKLQADTIVVDSKSQASDESGSTGSKDDSWTEVKASEEAVHLEKE